MDAIELRGVTVAHGDDVVLRDASLTVPAGEVTALLASSGGGKTTLLRAVAGLHPVRSGRVLLGGRDVTDLPTAERDLGMVLQGAPLHPGRDVEGNLAFPLEVRGDDRVAARSRARGEALRFGVARLLGRRPDQLSTGERAAAATVRSVMRTPSALLLDEPATHLDPRTRAQVLQQIGIVQRTRGTTVLVATNELDVASALASRVAVLDRGTVAQAGVLTTLRNRPVSLDVADLVHVAPLSRLHGAVEPGVGGRPTHVVTRAGALRTWDTLVRDRPGPVVVGLAQHDLTLGAAGDGDLRGVVVRVATTGGDRLVGVRTDGGVVTVALDGRSEAPPSAGDAVGLVVRRWFVASPDGAVLAVVTRPGG